MKHLNLLTRIILTFFLAFVIIMVVAGYIIYNEGSGKINSLKNKEIHAELNNMVNMLAMVQKHKRKNLQYSFKTASRVFDNDVAQLELDTTKEVYFKAQNQKTNEIEDIKLPMLLANGKQLHYNYELVDKIRSMTGANATIFQRFEKGFIRISTNITGADMHRATGSYIPMDSEVSRNLLNGKSYQGKAFVVDRYYLSIYEPIKIKGKTQAALFVGKPIRNFKKLEQQLLENDIFQLGNPLILSADAHTEGRVLLGKQFQNENWKKHPNAAKAGLFANLKKDPEQIHSRPFINENEDFFYTFYEPLNLYLGINLPGDFLIAGLRSKLIRVLLFSFGIAIIISLIIVYFGMRQYSHKLEYTIESIDTLARGAIPDKTPDTNIPELVKINQYVNKLAESIKTKTEFAKKIGEGNLEQECCYGEIQDDVLAQSLQKMRSNLLQAREEQNRINWLQNATVTILQTLRKESDLYKAANKFLISLSNVLDIELGAVYLLDESNQRLYLAGTYGFKPKQESHSEFDLGEGVVGQAAKDKQLKIIKKISPDYVQVKYSAGTQTPKKIIAIPFVYNEKTVGVVELGTLVEDIPKVRFQLIDHISESVAVTFQNIQANKAREDLLEEVRNQKEELEKQAKELEENQQELKQTNEELQSQTRALEESEANLETQQEELRVTNEKLESNLQELQKQKAEVNEKNLALENTRDELKRQADELEKANRFKSEFLANMSHELRTPLNSLLILTQTMMENQEENLTNEQQETIQVIYNSGKDLLNLINDILDLSKIEAGKIDIELETIDISDSISRFRSSFQPSAKQKEIDFKVTIEKDSPQELYTDRQRMEQIIRNLLSNAIKFTSKGSVTLRFFSPAHHEGPQPEKIDAEGCLGISIIDTGMGIQEEKKEAIFEAFQQVDGSISRRFGGTGLGLSISKELSHFLGGEIVLQSTYGEGTTFTLFLPLDEKYRLDEKHLKASEKPNKETTKKAPGKKQTKTSNKQEGKKENTQNTETKAVVIEEPKVIPMDDDRDKIQNGDMILEIIEDDVNFARTLMNLARKKDFKVIATNTGEDGLRLCKKLKPTAIILDIKLPGIDGYEVLERIKADTEIRHIPVHITSGLEEDITLYHKGALGFLKKPVNKKDFNETLESIESFISKKVKTLLIVEDEPEQRKAIHNLLKSTKAEITECSRGKEAYELILNQDFDSIVLDLEMPDMTGFELLDKLEKEDIALPPVIIYTGKDLSREETEQLQKYAQSIIIKGVKSEERLLDETSLFLHSVITEFPGTKQRVIKNLHSQEDEFKNKQVLLVDDDIRSLFVLNRILEERGFQTQKAQNGQKALDVLRESKGDIDIVLMDIMMPVMDGYEATRQIKNDPGLKNIPVIALTAKGMKGDREKCMNAGANDYLVKPVDINKLMTTIKIWLQNQ